MSKLCSKLTVLVNSCDLYSDVWPLFFAALDEYWPNRTVQVLLNTEALSPGVEVNVKAVNCVSTNGEISWGARFRYALSCIKTEYVLVIYDDFILESLLNENELETIIMAMDSDLDIAAVYLNNKIGNKIDNYLLPDRTGNKYILLPNDAEYRLSTVPAIWRVKDILSYTGEEDTPWAWEAFGSYRTVDDHKKLYCPGIEEENIYKYNYKKGGAIYRGKWVREVVIDKNEKYKLNIDFSNRGFSVDEGHEKRSFKWKFDFILLGYKMVGFKVFHFIYKSLKAKFI